VKKYPNTCARRDDGGAGGRPLDRRQPGEQEQDGRDDRRQGYVNTSVDAINQRILGRYQNGLGKTWDDPNHMKFFNEGAVNFPYLSDGMWFLTQHKRWGLLKSHPDYLAVAKQVNQIDLYKQAASAMKAACPRTCMRTSKLIDGVVWDGKDPPSTPTVSRSRPERPSLQEKHHGQCRLSRALRRPHRSPNPRLAAASDATKIIAD
jgi:nitrate/nitrite transport system substrate-binding protein